MFQVPEKYRIVTGELKSSEKDGNKGAFLVPFERRKIKYDIFLQVIASDIIGFEHVSVIPVFKSGKHIGRKPTWEEMSFIKNLFWNDKGIPDIVIQFYIPEVLEVKTHPLSLHLYKKIGSIYELPSK